MADKQTDPVLWALEVESEDEFLNRVEALVTKQADSLQAMRNVRELCILYEARAGFLVELKERFEQSLNPESGVTVPDREDMLEVLGDHEDEIRAEWDATEPVPDISILEMLWPGEPPKEELPPASG
jgi:hypothetical protein